MTVRLYYADSYLREFEAEVLERRDEHGRMAAVLDQTAFYPTSGGQPHDTGTLGSAGVIDVVDTGDVILHVVTAEVGGRVTGRIDWTRRFDHMQQHTGQHIISQAFAQILNAQTQSVHFGTETSTVDLDLSMRELDDASRVEDLANAVVFEDRVVLVREVEENALEDLRLRRPAKRHGRVRVVQIEDFDRSACGGTHVRRTGEVGPIKIIRSERYKGGVRVEFLCGWRVLRDYRRKHAILLDLATQFTVKDTELKDAVGRMSAQLKDRERVLTEARERLLGYEAAERLTAASGDPKVIADVIGGRPFDELTLLAGKIAAMARAVAVFGSPEGRIVIARNPDMAFDAREILTRAVQPLGGKGGGRPEFAQGAVRPDAVRDAVDAVVSQITRR